MSNMISLSYVILITAPLFFGCNGSPQEENKNNESANSISLHFGNEKYYIIDTKESVVAWTGSSVKGAHIGYVYISKGELMIENGQLVGGTVEVGMSTIEGDDHRSDNNLIKHLKDADFFDVTKFPFSTIAITRVASINGESKNVTGNLTIKGITHPVTFPARIEVKGGIVKASGKLIIDRTLWNVRYRSGKFFNNLKDQAISDNIEFNVEIVAKK
jgi:polyisoprenoid-binding protein YceI